MCIGDNGNIFIIVDAAWLFFLLLHHHGVGSTESIIHVLKWGMSSSGGRFIHFYPERRLQRNTPP